jgi:hypothetical protein
VGHGANPWFDRLVRIKLGVRVRLYNKKHYTVDGLTAILFPPQLVQHHPVKSLIYRKSSFFAGCILV